ncbi:MAG: hypothetical protein HZR80_12530 [Candidatus Heimdallarchaeota archaeon]
MQEDRKEKKQQTFYERIKEEADKEERNPLAIYKIISETIFEDIEEIEDKKLLKAYDYLDSIIDPLPVFLLADKLPEQEKTDRYMFFLNDIFSSSLQLIGISTHILDNLDDSFWTSIKKSILQLITKGGISDLLSRYCIEWETQYNIFVKPVSDRLIQKRIIPKPRRGRHNEIRALVSYFSTSDELNIFNPILECLKTEFRNAVVHLNYWIDNECKIIYYYNIKKHKIKIKKMTFEDLCKNLSMLILFKIAYIAQIATKIE